MEGLGNIAYECTSHPYNIKTSTSRSGLFIGNLSDVMDDYEIKSIICRKFTTKKYQVDNQSDLYVHFFSFFFFLSQVTLNKLHGWLEWTKKFLGVYHVLVSLGFYGVYVYSSILDEGPLVKPYPL